MAIKIIKYEGQPDVLAWKYPSDELGTWTQVIVNQSQEALLFKSGKALDLFGAGRHTLKTQNIPLLGKLAKIPFGGQTPFKAEVWYINKLVDLDVKWGTMDPIQLQDPKYGVFVPVRSFGQFGIQIKDSRKFIVKLVGTAKQFDKPTLVKYFRGIVMTKIKDMISEYLVLKRISLLDVNAYIDDISEEVGEKINETFQKYGVEVHDFMVNSINVPEDDPAVKKLKEALAKKAEMDIMGYTYQQQRSYDTMDKAASNEGGSSQFMNAGIGMAMGQQMGAAMGGQMAGVTAGLNPNQEATVTCPKCNAKNPANSKFCHSCGKNLKKVEGDAPTGMKKCPKCEALNPKDAKFCSTCGSKMELVCSNCNHKLAPGAKFCPNCGQKQ